VTWKGVNGIFWYRIADAKRNFISFFQRGKNGYAKPDLWSFDVYLSKVIGKGVQELANNSHGHPSELKTLKEWTTILNKMSRGFLNYSNKVFSAKNYSSEDEKKLEESLELFKKHFLHLWD
jgi:hypothetical protein